MSRLLLCIFILQLVAEVYQQITYQERQVFINRGVSFTDDPSDPDNYWLASHQGIPDHDYGEFPNTDNPNSVSEQDHQFRIPKDPVVLDTPECVRLGAIAVSFNGIPLFNPYSGFGYNAVEGENAEVFDACSGHPSPSGAYHYHQIPNCLIEQTNDQLIAVALDGYPIYGPLHNDVNLTSADLDDCHGWVSDTTDRYEYRITHDFPYVLGCFRGVSTAHSAAPSRKRRQGPRPPTGGGGNQPPGGANDGTFNPQSCLYVKFCENPAGGCPDTAYEFSGQLAIIPADGIGEEPVEEDVEEECDGNVECDDNDDGDDAKEVEEDDDGEAVTLGDAAGDDGEDVEEQNGSTQGGSLLNVVNGGESVYCKAHDHYVYLTILIMIVIK